VASRSTEDLTLSPAKRTLLEALIRKEGLGDSPLTRIAPRCDGSPAVLSSAQERLWLLDQLDPGSTLYNRPSSLRLSGQLDLAAAQASFNEIVRRHEILRTTFPAVAGQPHQQIAPARSAILPLVDLQSLPVMEREAQA